MAAPIPSHDSAIVSKTNTRHGSKLFTFRNTPIPILNSIRRTILRDVPTASFQCEPIENNTIEIIKNTSSLNNEIIRHRISLVPVFISDIKSENVSRYEFTIDVTNNNPGTILDVTTDDFQVRDRTNGSNLTREQVLALFPHDPISRDPVLIAKLKGPFGSNNGEQLFLKARLVQGTGKEHACFSPVSVASYRFTTDPTASSELFQMMVNEEKQRRARVLRKDPDDPDLLKDEEIEDLRKSFRTLGEARAYSRNALGDPLETLFEIETIGQ